MVWALFNSEPDKQLPAKHYIQDEDGLWPIDDEYRALGEREGWLQYIRYRRISRNEYILVYRLLG